MLLNCIVLYNLDSGLETGMNKSTYDLRPTK